MNIYQSDFKLRQNQTKAEKKLKNNKKLRNKKFQTWELSCGTFYWFFCVKRLSIQKNRIFQVSNISRFSADKFLAFLINCAARFAIGIEHLVEKINLNFFWNSLKNLSVQCAISCHTFNNSLQLRLRFLCLYEERAVWIAGFLFCCFSLN